MLISKGMIAYVWKILLFDEFLERSIKVRRRIAVRKPYEISLAVAQRILVISLKIIVVLCRKHYFAEFSVFRSCAYKFIAYVCSRSADLKRMRSKIAPTKSEDFPAAQAIMKREMPFNRAIELARYYNISLDYIAGLTDIPKTLDGSIYNAQNINNGTKQNITTINGDHHNITIK